MTPSLASLVGRVTIKVGTVAVSTEVGILTTEVTVKTLVV